MEEGGPGRGSLGVGLGGLPLLIASGTDYEI
jgi:hypothetical protein